MPCQYLNVYNENDVLNISYDSILELPVRYPQFVIKRPLGDEYLFYYVPGKKFYNYIKN